jgi:hypothetical protein
MESSQIRLYVIGLGIRIPGHTTIEAAHAMSQCMRLYSIVQEPAAWWLPPRHISVPIVSLLPMYVEGELRTSNYDRVANAVFTGLEEVSTVGYVTYGNPLAYDSVGQKLVRDARTAGIACRVIPGISSVDTILCDLGRDMAPGVQIYEASWLVATGAPLNISVATILLQLGHFGSDRAHYRERRPADALAPLVGYLGRFFPNSHEVFLVQSASGDRAPMITGVALGRLSEVTVSQWAESIYVPPLESAQARPAPTRT